MTDNEIIKALECCHTTVDETECPNCPSYDTELGDCNGIPWKPIIDIINRQKEEIERLNRIIKTQDDAISKLLSIMAETNKKNGRDNNVDF